VRLLTVGHGTTSAQELAAVLTGAGVELVVDVRRHPGSRRHPDMGAEAMRAWLAEAGIDYLWEPRLGGRRPVAPGSPDTALREPAFRGYAAHMRGPEFAAGLDLVLARAAATTTAVLCAETLWWRCHRRLVADAATLLHGAEVVHLGHGGHGGRLAPHRPTPGVRVDGDTLVYDVGQTAPLPGAGEAGRP
jgi:uncharacterized protein (DUF488 family)